MMGCQKRLWLGVLCGASTLTLGFELHTEAQQVQSPVFRSGVAVVRLDANVLDRDRQPIRGLTKDDFTVLVDGVIQPLVDVVEVGYGAFVTDEGWSNIPPEFVSNHAPVNRRAFIIVLDDANTPSSPYTVKRTKDAARMFVNGLHPNDLVAVVYSERSVHNQELTADRALVLKAIDEFCPMRVLTARSGGPETTELTARVASSRTLRAAVMSLRDIPHVRSAVVLIGPGISTPSHSIRSLGSGSVGGVDSGSLDPISDFNVLSGAESVLPDGRTGYARVPIYAISSGGLTTAGIVGAGLETRAEFLQRMADESGGYAVVNTNDFRPGVQQILREAGHHYLIGYEPTYPVQDGRYRRLDVRVQVHGAQVFPSNQVSVVPRQAARAIEPSPRTAISGILPVSDIPLALRATPARPTSRRGSADVAIDLMIGPIAHPAGKAMIECAAFNSSLSEVGATGKETTLASGHTVRLTLALPSGRYHLRCGVYAPALEKKTGSVYTHITVPER